MKSNPLVFTPTWGPKKSGPGLAPPPARTSTVDQPKNVLSCQATIKRESKYVTVVGFYGRGNFGDDVMCSALTRFILKNSSNKVRIISSDPTVQRDLACENVDVVRRKLTTVLRSLKDSEILCQGGGTIFHDSYTGRQLLRYWAKLCMWAVLFWIARFRGVRVVIVGAGVGPLTHRISRTISRLAFSACNAIGVRDQASVDTIRRLALRTRCELGLDLAMLGFVTPPVTKEVGERTHKVLAISACSLTEFLGSANLNQRYWQALGDALAIFHEEQPIRVIFLSLFTGSSSESDEKTANLIASRLPREVQVEYRRYAGCVETFWKEFERPHWFLCTKFHAAVAAFLCGRNFAVIAYNRKVNDLADEINLPFANRVNANAPQPISVWLKLLRQFENTEGLSRMLHRDQAEKRATQAVRNVFETAGASMSF